jgi:DNA-binding winged helix-turn-helix (wHTH) protein
MEATPGEPNRISLVVDPKSAAVIVAGRRIALPAKQFALMRELTADPGAALEASEVIARVWEGRPGMASSDLHALVWRLRRRIGDTGSEPQVIVNRKGLGYLINIEAVEVTVMEGPGDRPEPASTAPGEDAAEARFDAEAPTSDPSPRLDVRVAAVVERAELDAGGSSAAAARVRSAREEGAVDPMAPVGGTATEVPTSGSREVDARHEGVRPAMNFGDKSLRWWIAAAGVVLAMGAVGFLGGLVTSETPEADDDAMAAESEPTASPAQANPGHRPPKNKSRRPSRSQPARNPGGGSGAGVAATPPVAAPAPPTALPAISAPRQHKPPPKRQPVALPPPPTRYLYHLYNAENGDHFVTTDGGAVTEHEAKGYEGGAIARVYVASEKDTQAIALNYGRAFIFIDASPKTDPASTPVALWLAKNNAGDFFYSTSKSEASQDGWSASLIGYVRAL